MFRRRWVKEAAICYCLQLHPGGLYAETLSEITGIGYASMHHYLRRLIQRGDVKSLITEPGADPPRYRYFVSLGYRRGLEEFKAARRDLRS